MAKVFFIMTDGMRPDALQAANTPHLEGLIQRGASTMTARSVMPCWTLPCHTSIFHSVLPQQHGILTNDWHPFAQPFVGLVEHLKNRDKRTGFFHNWEPLRNLNKPEQLAMSFFIEMGFDVSIDDLTTQAAIDYYPQFQFNFTFVYMGSIDIAGHLYGWMSPEYLRTIEHVDSLIGRLLTVVSDDDYVVVHSDHGGHEQYHGEDIPEDMTIPFIVTGPTIKPNYQIQRTVSLLDTAPTIAHLLGIQPHGQWQGQIIEEMFT